MKLLRYAIIPLICISGIFVAAQQNDDAPRPIVVGYFPGWGIRNHFFVKNLISQGAADTLDQINYASAHVVNNECVIGNPANDLNHAFSSEDSVDGTADSPDQTLRGNFHQLQELKRQHPEIKILISLEGDAKPFVDAAQPTNRAGFVASCIQKFIKGKFADGITAAGIFDGVDIDWEYPREADRFNFIALLGEFRRQLNAAGSHLLLTVAMGDNRATYRHLDMEAVALYVDEVGVMNYDYTGPWSKRTGLLAPLYTSPGDPERGGDVDSTIRDYREMGVPESKILMGIPFYAYSWNEVSQDNRGLFQAGEASRVDQPYNYVASIEDKFTEYRDPNSQAPWLFDGKTFWTYDDEKSISAKLKYAKEQHLGGVMIWELSGDTDDGQLLGTISDELKNDDE